MGTVAYRCSNLVTVHKNIATAGTSESVRRLVEAAGMDASVITDRADNIAGILEPKQET